MDRCGRVGLVRAAALGAAYVIAAGASAQSEPQWLPGEGVPGVNGGVTGLVAFDLDGPGPRGTELIAAGLFSVAGGTQAGGVAAWNGSSWRDLGAGVRAIDALLVHDPDGAGPAPPELVVVGTFAEGDDGVAGAGRWVGDRFERFTAPMRPYYSSNVHRLAAYFDPDGPGPEPERLFSTDTIYMHGEYPVPGIVEWNGAAWVGLGPIMSGNSEGQVVAMSMFDPDGPGPLPGMLVIAGVFDHVGDVAVQGVAAWDGRSWRGLGTGLSNAPYGGVGLALAVFDPDGPGPTPAELVVGGNFSAAGGVAARSLAAWDGERWREFGGGVAGYVRSLLALGPDGADPARLVVGGYFLQAGGQAVTNIAVWSAGSWSGLGGGIPRIGTDDRPAEALAWFDPGGGPGRLVVGGQFRTAGGQGVLNIAACDGTNWSALGAGFNNTVLAVDSYDPDGPGPRPAELIAAGVFNAAGGSTASCIAAHDGTTWRPLGSGLTHSLGVPEVDCLARFDPDGPGPEPELLVAGGSFQAAGGIPVRDVAAWDGSAWRGVGDCPLQAVRALVALDAGGPGLVAVGLTVYGAGVAQWDGAMWSVLGAPFVIDPPLNQWPELRAAAVYDPDGPGPAPAQLYVGGRFNKVGNQPISGIARWDGAAWRAVGTGLTGRCYALTVYDPDGPGPSPPVLVASGFMYLSGVRASVVSWDGVQWRALLGATSSPVALTVWDADGPGPAGPVLIAAGDRMFDPVTLADYGNVAGYDGAVWRPLGTWLRRDMYSGYVDAVASFDPGGGAAAQLVAGGQFFFAGGSVSASVARWASPPGPPCYANCDGSGSPALSVADFACFLNRFAAGDPWANCDGSSVDPVLTVNDFICFMNQYARGCP